MGRGCSNETRELMRKQRKGVKKKKFKKGYKQSSDHIAKRVESRKKNPNFREVYKKVSIALKNKPKSENHKKKLSLSKTGKKDSNETKISKSKARQKFLESEAGYKHREMHKNLMLNGGAAYCNKFIKNPSKPELMLKDIVLELFPTADPQHQVFNYSIDIAIVEYKIAVEFDGWYHFNSPEAIEYHKNRQKRIEDEGWTFLRYNIYKKFPTKEQIEKDIINLIKDFLNEKVLFIQNKFD